MLGLQEISVRNFLSWGDYDTKIQLNDRGPCFIAGLNGAGKSSLMQAILWCVSGKTMYNPRPGNGILNWFTECDCEVTLKLSGGSKITRIRKQTGDTELLYSKEGRDVIDCTLSTTGNQQRLLDRELDFDYDVFCGSVFFNQYRHRWMEMSDQARKQVLERIMGVDRLSIYAEVAKEKRDRVEKEQIKLRQDIKQLESAIADLNDQIQSLIIKEREFESDRDRRATLKHAAAKTYREEADKFEPIDIDPLIKRWDLISKVKAKLADLRSKTRTHDDKIEHLEEELKRREDKLSGALDENQTVADKEISELETAQEESEKDLNQKLKSAVSDLNRKKSKFDGAAIGAFASMQVVSSTIKLWEDKKGQICTECEQTIPKEHAAAKIEPHLAKRDELDTEALAAEADSIKVDKQIEALEAETKSILDRIAEDTDKSLVTVRNACDLEETKIRETIKTADIEDQIAELKDDKQKIQKSIDSGEEKLANATPDKTVDGARAENAKLDIILERAETTLGEATAIDAEENPYLITIGEIDARISPKQTELDGTKEQLSKYDTVYAHLHYVYRAYSDRRKIKSFVVGRHRPYLNQRLNHYLDSFDLDVKIQLSSSLGISSNLWGYDYQSGGERARTNLAFMFAVFDLHNGIHGRQCNMLVLDEPDHHLDDTGTESLTNIIRDDLAARFETIFIISHNNSFRNAFPSQITIQRQERLSYLADIR